MLKRRCTGADYCTGAMPVSSVQNCGTVLPIVNCCRSRSAASITGSGRSSRRVSSTGRGRGSFLQGVIAVGLFAILASLLGVVLAFSWVEGRAEKNEAEQPWLRTFENLHGFVNKRGSEIHASIQKAGIRTCMIRLWFSNLELSRPVA